MILAIFGKIASGKSEVLKILKKRGFYCIKADKIVARLYKKNGTGAKMIAKIFGKTFLRKHGGVDRKKLRNLVFNNKAKLELLNKIIHPLVYAEIKAEIQKVSPKFSNIAIEAVYLNEKKLVNLVDKILWVQRPLKMIKEVLMKKRGFSEEMGKKAIFLINKPKKVDFILQNIASLKILERRVGECLKNFYIL